MWIFREQIILNSFLNGYWWMALSVRLASHCTKDIIYFAFCMYVFLVLGFNQMKSKIVLGKATSVLKKSRPTFL